MNFGVKRGTERCWGVLKGIDYGNEYKHNYRCIGALGKRASYRFLGKRNRVFGCCCCRVGYEGIAVAIGDGRNSRGRNRPECDDCGSNLAEEQRKSRKELGRDRTGVRQASCGHHQRPWARGRLVQSKYRTGNGELP